jgi:hypothetical protein
MLDKNIKVEEIDQLLLDKKLGIIWYAGN